MCEEESFLAQCSLRLSLCKEFFLAHRSLNLERLKVFFFLFLGKVETKCLCGGLETIFPASVSFPLSGVYECFHSLLPVNFFLIWFNQIETWLSNRRA